jgi:hypothetical protein
VCDHLMIVVYNNNNNLNLYEFASSKNITKFA